MQEKMTESPFISNISWGEVIVGSHQRYKDVKLFPGGSREWDWNETGTKHVPGIQPADVTELLEYGSEHIVLSQGMYKRLRVTDETKKLLNDRDIPFEVLPTKKAVEKYNQLREKIPVGALIHSTC